MHTWAISARGACLQGLCFPHWNLNTLLAQNFLSCVSNTLPRRKWLPAMRHHSSVITSVSTNIPTEICLKVFTQTKNKHTSVSTVIYTGIICMHILLTQHLHIDNIYLILQHKTTLDQYNFQPQSLGRLCKVCLLQICIIIFLCQNQHTSLRVRF